MKDLFVENGIRYIRTGDYYIPDIKLNEEPRPIGRYGRMRRDYLREHRPVLYNQLVLDDKLWTHLADLNEQATQRMETLICQMQIAEGVTEDLKSTDPMTWVQRMNNIHACAEEITKNELIFN